MKKRNPENAVKLIIIISLYFINVQTLYGQLRFDYPIKTIEPVNIVANYTLEFIEDTLNTYYIRKDNMVLFIGPTTSKFISQDMYTFDTIMKNITSLEQFQAKLLDQANPLPMAKNGYKIFKNYPAGFISYIEHIPSTTYRYEEDLHLFEWDLYSDTATINGHFSQKAVTTYGGRDWIAWFTKDIPYSDGPYKFCGLPGLIARISDTKSHYIFELESMEEPYSNCMIDIVEKDFLYTDRKGFLKAKNNFYSNIVAIAKDRGMSKESQQTIARRKSEKNNPIELH